MNVGILTFHHGRNHGGYLQTFALQKVVSGLGHQCTVINYVNQKHYWAEVKMHWKPLRARFGYTKKWLQFSASLRQLPQTKLVLSSGQLEKLPFDVIIVGSDEVWNFYNPLFGIDMTFFGAGLDCRKKVAFAVSFGSTDAGCEIPDEIKRHIGEFQQLSVRDANSKMILEEILEQDIPLVLDPAFLYDFRDIEHDCNEQDFVLVYSTGLRPTQIARVISMARAKNLQTISIGYYNKWCDINVVACDPFAWLGYFRAAHSVVTSMFHGTIFAIVYEKNFVTFITPYRQNKFNPMMENLGLLDRIGTDQSALIDIMQKPPDYERIKKSLNIQVENSVEFLKMAIGEKTEVT